MTGDRGSLPAPPASGLAQRVAAGSAGRDRVLDAAKAFALFAVVVGHSLAWNVTPQGTAGNVLEVAPGLRILTWVFQVLPLFFAAGAVANAGSLARHGADGFWRHRARSLLTPVLVYVAVWTCLLLPFSLWWRQAADAGRFLSQLLWFAGVYLLVVAASPLTARWRSRPWLTLGAWLAAIVAVDAVRVHGGPSWIGWLNLLLVWGWLHQVGYYLPALRGRSRGMLTICAVAALGLAVALAVLGPYSTSLVTVGGDPELSNLSPPSAVLALYGLAQILLLAALWPTLQRWLSNDRRWLVVALFGARGMGIYLWHIPLVGVAAGTALALGWSVPPLSAPWWAVHLTVVAVVLPVAWVLAGVAARGESAIRRWPRLFGLPSLLVAVAGGAVVLNISVTGFGTWTGKGMLGLPSTSWLNLLLLLLLWQATAGPRSRTTKGSEPVSGSEPLKVDVDQPQDQGPQPERE